MPGAMSPGVYNHNYQILQTPDHVAILVEMIHDVRIIPLDGRSHVSPRVGQWLGDSRGRWEGDTLVVETTNLPASDRVVVERFTRVDADTIDYRIAVTDPAEWTAPWTAAMPMSPTTGPLHAVRIPGRRYSLTREGPLGAWPFIGLLLWQPPPSLVSGCF